MSVLVLVLTIFKLSCSAYSAGRKDIVAIGGSSRVRQVGKWTWQGGTFNRMEEPTGGQEKQLESQSNQAVVQTWQLRLAGVRPQRHTGLCPRTAVHPLISDGSKLFWSKIISPRQGPSGWQVFLSGQIKTAMHRGWSCMCVCVFVCVYVCLLLFWSKLWLLWLTAEMKTYLPLYLLLYCVTMKNSLYTTQDCSFFSPGHIRNTVKVNLRV